MLEILKKLRSNSPEWYARYVTEYEHDYSRNMNTLLSCAPDQLARMQGICAAQSSHLLILKQAL